MTGRILGVGDTFIYNCVLLAEETKIVPFKGFNGTDKHLINVKKVKNDKE